MNSTNAVAAALYISGRLQEAGQQAPMRISSTPTPTPIPILNVERV